MYNSTTLCATTSVPRALLLAPYSNHDEDGDVELRKRNRDWSRDRQRVACTCYGRVRKHRAEASHEQHTARAGRCPSAHVGSRRLRRASVARGRSSSQDATVRFPQASSRWSGSSSSAVRTVSRAASREGTSLRRPLEQPDDERADAGPTASEAVSAAGKASQAWRADASNAGKK